MLWVSSAIIVAAAAILLLWTAPSWLSRMLGGLDTFLVRMGAGTWAAGFITWVENRAAERRAMRSDKEGRSGAGPIDQNGTS